jgi:xylulokinase
MNLMDLRRLDWSPAALEAAAPGLAAKLPPIVPSDTVLGPISPYFVAKYGFAPTAQVLAWSGDNPNSLVGVGLICPGRVCISLGTSDTYFGAMPEPNVDPAGEGHVFGSPAGGYMSLICFKNGSLAREAVRDAYGMTWDDFSAALRITPGHGGAIMLPYFDPEIVPKVLEPRVYRYGLDEADGPANVRAVVEAQMMSMALHSRWMGVTPDTIYATGGAAANRDLLTVMANVHDADVYQFEVRNSAALGAALRAAHGYFKAQGREVPWAEIVAGFAEPVAGSKIRPDPAQVALYRDLLEVYRACEDHALRGGPDPEPARAAFASR